MQAAGLWRGSSIIDWPLAMGNLTRALTLAILSRRGDGADGWELTDTLIRLMDNDWALTIAGLEHRGHSVVVPEADFPATPAKPWARPADTWPPDRPAWTSAEEWAQTLNWASSEFPRDHAPFRTKPPLVPWHPIRVTGPARSGGEFTSPGY